jgi:hypothetical protein
MPKKKDVIDIYRPQVETIPTIKPMFNVGGRFDLITGKWVTMKDGSSVINGGLSQYFAVSGPANSYKSTVLQFFKAQAMDKLCHLAVPSALTYDTENTYDYSHLSEIISSTDELKHTNVITDSLWMVVSKNLQMLDEFWKTLTDWMAELAKGRRKLLSTPMYDVRKRDDFKMPFPPFVSIDSVSEAESTNVEKKNKKLSIGDKKARMYFMDTGFDKARVLTMLGPMAMRAGAFIQLTSHLGDKNAISGDIPTKELTDMPVGKILKGVPDKFRYLLINIFLTKTAVVSKTDANTIRFPITRASKSDKPGDLQTVVTTLVRSKSSISGGVVKAYVSQTYGLQPTLTELMALKEECNGFGIIGNNTTYAMAIYPEVKMMRTTLRELIASDPKLRRAICITSEMEQTFSRYLFTDAEQVCTPEQLYNDLIEMGYDWDKILQSRGWWTLEDDKHPIPRLTTMDLLNIRIGKYKAPWAMATGKGKKNAK